MDGRSHPLGVITIIRDKISSRVLSHARLFSLRIFRNSGHIDFSVCPSVHFKRLSHEMDLAVDDMYG